jgi:hypothetical protein
VGEARLRVGLDAHMVGGQETGNETYVKGLVDGFRDSEEEVDVIAYHTGSPWMAPGRHVRFQRLVAGNPYVRLGV